MWIKHTGTYSYVWHEYEYSSTKKTKQKPITNTSQKSSKPSPEGDQDGQQNVQSVVQLRPDDHERSQPNVGVHHPPHHRKRELRQVEPGKKHLSHAVENRGGKGTGSINSMHPRLGLENG